MGGFDPIDSLSQVIKAHAQPNRPTPWLHVDGSWGGSALFSEQYRLRHLKGLDQADSFVVNPHKGLGVPIHCSALVVHPEKHAGLLERTNESNAEYLFHKHAHKSLDLGDRSLQCGRRADGLKLWLSWKRYGWAGFRDRVDRNFEAAQQFAAKVQARNFANWQRNGSDQTKGWFQLVIEPQTCNICFWYISPTLRKGWFEDIDATMHTDLCVHSAPQNVAMAVGRLTNATYRVIQQKGSMLLNFNPLKDHNLPAFFRLVIVQGQRIEEEDLDMILSEIESAGDGLCSQELYH